MTGAVGARIKSAELVIGYALSRLGEQYLSARGHTSWREAYEELVRALGRTPGSWKRLRDEFDPFFSNERRGFHGRAMRPDRAYVFAQMEEVDDRSLLELVNRFVAKDWTSTEEVIEIVSAPPTRMANVARRLLTGRQAEEFFLQNSHNIVGQGTLKDARQEACGYDFGLSDGRIVEVKGLREARGSLLFTNLEWTVARERQDDYLLIVVAHLDTQPLAHVLRDPTSHLKAVSVLEARLSTSWRASFALGAEAGM